MSINQQDNWVVNLKLNTSSFSRDVKKAEAELNKLSQDFATRISMNLGSSISNTISTSIKNGLNRSLSISMNSSSGLAAGVLGAFVGGHFIKSFLKAMQQTKTSASSASGFSADANAIYAIQQLFKTGQKFSASDLLYQIKTAVGAHGGMRGFGVPGGTGGKPPVIPPPIIDGLGAAGDGMGFFAQAAGALSKVLPLLFHPITLLTTAVIGLGVAAEVSTPLLAGLQAVGIQMSMGFLQAYADVQQLEFGLKRVGASAAQIKDTLNLGKEPGLSQEQAANATMKFAANGFSIEEANLLTIAFSKTATSAEQYGSIINALSQILGKGKLSSEELTQQLGESVPGFSKILKDTFGKTAEELVASGMAPTEFITKLAVEMNKIKSPANSAQSAIDNFDDSMKKLKANFGKGLAVTLLPLIDSLTTKFDELVSSGKLDELGKKFGTLFQSDALIQMLDGLMSFAGLLADISTKVGDLIGGFKVLADTPAFKWLAGVGKKASDAAGGVGGLIDFIPGIGGIKQLIDPFIQVGEQQRIKENANRIPSQGGKDISAQLKALAEKGGINKIIEAEDKERSSLAKKQLEVLRKIADNTKPDLQRTILGGGNLGAIGVTPMELSRQKTQFGPRVDALVHDLLSEIWKATNGQNRYNTSSGYSL